MTLIQRIEAICVAAFETCGFEPRFGAVQVSDRPDLTDFQCNGALAVAKKERRNPREVAQAIIDAMQGHADLFTVDIAGPGFLNLTATDAALADHALALRDDARSMVPVVADPGRFLVDYGGPNTAKEMHVGHLRASIIGQTLKTLLRFAGHSAEGDIHLGDWGLQMGQLITYVEDNHPEIADTPDAPITMEDLQGWYPLASGLSKSDEAFRKRAQRATQQLQAGEPRYMQIWNRMNDASLAALRRDYDWLGVDFEYWYGESRYQKALDGILEDVMTRGIAIEDDGAIIIRMQDDDKLPPLMMRNAAGGYGYGATDVATLSERVGDGFETVLYVVDQRQATHFKQLFNATAQMGLLNKTRAEHIGFGTVNGTDGKPFKTREGGTMRLVDLFGAMTDAARKRLDDSDKVDPALRDTVAAQVARAAIKFGELSHDREKNYIFDMEKFLQFEGKTGPYIQYSRVRVRTLVDAAAQAGLTPGPVTDLGVSGRDLILAMDGFPAAFERSIQARKPSHLTNQIYRLADATNRFYQQNRVLQAGLDAGVAGSYLSILTAAARQIDLGLALLGIDLPEQM